MARTRRRSLIALGLAAPALLLTACGSRDRLSSDAGTTVLPSVPLTTIPPAQRVQFRPVLSVAEARGPCQPVPQPPLDQQLTLPRCRGDDVVERLVVGPAFLIGDAVEAAEPVIQPGSWSVKLTFKEGAPGIDTFNDWATRCYEKRPECPDTGFGNGAIAIVFDGEVLSSPTVQAPTFQRDLISVTVEDEATAGALAAALPRAGS
jgi:SecDF, P1 head subdomain